MKLQFIPSGKPTKSAFIERFNSIIRDDCLNQRWSTTLDDARKKLEEGRGIYSTIRPLGSLGRLTTEEYATAARSLTEQKAG